MTLPSITGASYTCTDKKYTICVCKKLPDGIHATRVPSGNRRRASVRRAIPRKQQCHWTYLYRRTELCLPYETTLHAKLNEYAGPSNKTTTHTVNCIRLILQGLNDRAIYAPDPFPKNFRRLLHRVTTTHATVVFFQMVKL